MIFWPYLEYVHFHLLRPFSLIIPLEKIANSLKLSYNTSNKLDKIIDTQLPGRPEFQRHEVVVQGESMEYFSRPVLECIKALWGDPDFSDDLIFSPERHYTDADETVRAFHEMHTGKWWWRTQVCTSVH